MGIAWLDHIDIRTADLDVISRFYAVVPGRNIRRVNVFGAEGNYAEVPFGREEETNMAPFTGRPGARGSSPAASQRGSSKIRT